MVVYVLGYNKLSVQINLNVDTFIISGAVLTFVPNMFVPQVTLHYL